MPFITEHWWWLLYISTSWIASFTLMTQDIDASEFVRSIYHKLVATLLTLAGRGQNPKSKGAIIIDPFLSIQFPIAMHCTVSIECNVPCIITEIIMKSPHLVNCNWLWCTTTIGTHNSRTLFTYELSMGPPIGLGDNCGVIGRVNHGKFHLLL